MPYFIYVVRVFERNGPIAQAILVAFLVAAVLHGVVNGGAHILMAVRYGAARGDERDAAIDARSLRVAYFALISLVMMGLSTIAFVGAISTPSSEGRIWVPTFSVTSQFVLFCFIVAEALRYLTQVICYRREAWA